MVLRWPASGSLRKAMSEMLPANLSLRKGMSEASQSESPQEAHTLYADSLINLYHMVLSNVVPKYYRYRSKCFLPMCTCCRCAAVHELWKQ